MMHQVSVIFLIWFSQSFECTPPQENQKIICNFNNCTGRVSILLPSPPAIEITAETIQATLNKINRRVEVIYQKTSRYTAICEFAFTHQDARDCIRKTYDITLGKQELQYISDRKGAPIGKICEAPGECEVEECNKDDLIDRIHGNRRFQFQGAYFKNRLTSSCTSDYQSETFFTKDHAMLRKIEGTMYIVINDKTGQQHRMDPEEDYYDKTADGYEMYVKKTEVKTEQVEVKCIQRNKKAYCVTTKSELVPVGQVFEMDSQSEGIADSSEIILHKQINDVENTKLINLGAASTIGDVVAVLQMVGFDQFQAQYNTLTLSKEIMEIRSLLSNAIKTLSMTNPSLIGDLTKSKSYTKWVDTDSFVQCPCADFKTREGEGLCKGKMIFKDGLWQIREEHDECYVDKSRGNTTATWTPFLNDTLSLEVVNIPELLESIHDQIKDQEGKDVYDHVQIITTQSPWFDFIHDLWVKIVTYHSFVVNIIVWILFINFIKQRQNVPSGYREEHIHLESHN